MFGSGWPFMAQTISVFGSLAFSRRTPRDNGGLPASPDRCRSAAECAVYFAPGFRPAVFSTSASGTPVHSAQPAPPLVHWLPRAGGENAARPLPPHSSTMRRVTALYFDLSSPSVSSSLLLTSPSMVIFHFSGSFVSSGICPLLRI